QSGLNVQLPGAATPTPSSANLVLEFGGKGSGAGLMDDPRYVAIDPDGNIFVGDYADGRVQKFDPTGKFLLLINVPPDNNDNLYITGMAADYKGNLYLTRGGDILKYNAADGQLLTTFKGHFPDTSYDGLAVDATNTLYALHTTASDNDLITLSPDGKVLNRWNKIVTGVNKKDPGMQLQVAPDGVGNLYISSGFGNVVYVFDKNGKYVNRFGQEGHDPGQMSNPGQIAVDGQNRVYVHNFGAIDRFDTSGRFLDRLPTDYTKGSPMGFTLDLKGSLYVVTNNGKVLKYQLKGAG
ncbi:MAG TPA: NHL repeat-containing protein, partial [Anaerolineae bacterium]